MKKWILLILVILLFPASVFAEESEDDLALVQKEGILRLGVSPEYIPFVFYEEDTLTGLDVALMEEIGRRMGVKVEPIDFAFDGLIDSLNVRQIDVIGGGFSITEEREQLLDLTHFYYTGDAEFIALASMTKPASIELSNFSNLKIGVEKGTVFEEWIKTNLVKTGYVSLRNIFTYSDLSSAMKALNRKVVDLVLTDGDAYDLKYQPTGKYQVFYSGFSQERYAFGLRKHSTLTQVINQHLLDMIYDGTAQKIANVFFSKNYSENGITRPDQIMTPTVPIIVVPTKSPVTTCSNAMAYVSDVTIPDNQRMSPGEHFRKTWRIRNSGTCAWTQNYSLVFVSGNQMNGKTVSIPAYIAPGESLDISVDLIAPYADGTYQGFWQMLNPQGSNFGQSVWVKIRVGNDWNPTPLPPDPNPWYPTEVPSNVEILSFYPDFFEGVGGTCVSVHWSTNGAASVDINVDGQVQYSGGPANGSTQICGPIQEIGTHNVQLYAYNDFTYARADFSFLTEDFLVF